MITSLTWEQESKFAEYVSRWKAIGLSTDPIDKPKAEEAIKKCYEKAGLEIPKKIIWCGSPFSQVITRAMLIHLKDDSVRKSLWESVKSSLWASITDSIWECVRELLGDCVMSSIWASILESIDEPAIASVIASIDPVRNSISDSVIDYVHYSLRSSMSNSVYDSISNSIRSPVLRWLRGSILESIDNSLRDSIGSLRDSVMASAGESIGMSLGISLWNSAQSSLCGAHDSGWLSYYSFMRNELGLIEQTEPITGLLELVSHSEEILPCKEICFASERHNVLKRDERGRLHCVDGPAISYPDGWNIYAIRGVRVPEYVVTSPRQITVEKIEAEKDVEVKRVMINIYGQKRYMKDSGAAL